MSDGESLAHTRMRCIVTDYTCFSIDDEHARYFVAKLHAFYNQA